MYDIPIFDSLAHPTIDGRWLHPKYDGLSTLECLHEQMAGNNIQWGLAVNSGPGDEEDYAKFILSGSRRLFPVAFVDFAALATPGDVEPYLRRLKELGYAGIKIHPRFSRITYDHPCMTELISSANRMAMPVLLCTYNFENSARFLGNSLDNLVALLSTVPDEKVILIHGGAVNLLQMAEIARAFGNVLLDLSLTICKYEGSSLDLDIAFLFRNFDRRISVGSDFPEFSLADVRRRFEFFAKSVQREKLENIAYKNLFEFTGLAGL